AQSSDAAAQVDNLPEPLSARFVDSFAYKTVRDRLPVILAKVADSVCRRKSEFNSTNMDRVKSVIIGGVSRLRNELQTDKPLLPLSDSASDTTAWNDYLAELTETLGRAPSWFKEPWLYVECYMYRRLLELVNLADLTVGIDLFAPEKRQSLLGSAALAAAAAEAALAAEAEAEAANGAPQLRRLLRLCLSANLADLSLSALAEAHQLAADDANSSGLIILLDHTDQFVDCLRQRGPAVAVVHIVLDNVGPELVSDLCLAECLLRGGHAGKVRLHTKAAPWFVSDATELDLAATLDWLASGSAGQSSVQLAESLRSRLSTGQLSSGSDPFWTTWLAFADMETSPLGAKLYKKLSQADCVVLKGDLNYRKAVSDLAWPPTAPLAKAVGRFRPAPLLLVRTLKSNVVAGLAPGQAEAADAQHSDWMVAGKCGVLQFLPAENA
ncbi:hypothetical protein BOX15_Mlig000305g6, partial [Macrostomum lignano]|uniref:Sugar phosphate phosphatase n=2 Tax=Macrostomum lignano TaxID=282301 RepID=A0A1I8HLE8_9PLAT